MGDLNERDRGRRNSDDYLASNGSIEYKIIKLASFEGTYLIDLIYKSGGTDIWINVGVEKLD